MDAFDRFRKFVSARVATSAAIRLVSKLASYPVTCRWPRVFHIRPYIVRVGCIIRNNKTRERGGSLFLETRGTAARGSYFTRVPPVFLFFFSLSLFFFFRFNGTFRTRFNVTPLSAGYTHREYATTLKERIKYGRGENETRNSTRNTTVSSWVLLRKKKWPI